LWASFESIRGMPFIHYLGHTMDLSRALGPPQPLKRFLETMHSLPDQWLYIPLSVKQIEAETLCRACIIEDTELSPEEQDELEVYPETVGLKCFLCLSQLDDIVSNLRQQRPSFSERDLMAAINFYWGNDAFIDVRGGA
jgi:hypothetical protein